MTDELCKGSRNERRDVEAHDVDLCLMHARDVVMVWYMIQCYKSKRRHALGSLPDSSRGLCISAVTPAKPNMRSSCNARSLTTTQMFSFLRNPSQPHAMTLNINLHDLRQFVSACSDLTDELA